MLTKIVDYDYYSDTYEGSSIPGSSFNKYSISASSKVNFYTSNRIDETNLDNNIKNTICEIAEILYKQDVLIEKTENDTKEIASETVGPHSVSYVNKSGIQIQRILSTEELERKIYSICYEKLANTGLMFRGQNVSR